MRLHAAFSVCFILLVCIAPAMAGSFLPHKAHLTLAEKEVYFARSVRKDKTALAWLRSRSAPQTRERTSEIRWYQHALHWHRSLLADVRSKLLPDPRTYAGPCLAQIIDNEGTGWDPGRWNSQGSGAFGLPQALPYSKMPRAAWPRSKGGQENPYVQINWMRQYVIDRYGGCGQALAYWNAHRTY